MGMERKSVNNNVITASPRERTQSNPSPPSSVSSPSARPKKTQSLSNTTGGGGSTISTGTRYMSRTTSTTARTTTTSTTALTTNVGQSSTSQKSTTNTPFTANKKAEISPEIRLKKSSSNDVFNNSPVANRKTNRDYGRKSSITSVQSTSSQNKSSSRTVNGQISIGAHSANKNERTSVRSSMPIRPVVITSPTERRKASLRPNVNLTSSGSSKLTEPPKKPRSDTVRRISSVSLTGSSNMNSNRPSNNNTSTKNNHISGNPCLDKGVVKKEDVNSSGKGKTMPSRELAVRMSSSSPRELQISRKTRMTPVSHSSVHNKAAGSNSIQVNKTVTQSTYTRKTSTVIPSVTKGEKDEDQERNKRSLAEKGHSPVRERRRTHTEGTSKDKEKKRSQGETIKERDRRRTESDRHKERERRKEREKGRDKKSEADKLLEREKRDKKREHDRLKIDEREKRRSVQEGTPTKRKSYEKEKGNSVERVKRKSEEKEDTRRRRRRSSERDKRKSEEREKRSHERKKSPHKVKEEKERGEREKREDEEEQKQNTSIEHEVVSASDKVLSNSSSSGSLFNMVQQSSSSGGVGGEGGGAGGGSQTDLTEAERAELEKRERIQRYKEERRKQIAARYGTAEWSSSEESGTGEETTTSYKSYRRRRRAQHDPPDTSSTDAQTKSQENCNVEVRSTRRGSSSEDVVMGLRPNRSNRLRQGARNSSSSLNNNNSSNSNNNNNINNSANNNDHGNALRLDSPRDASLSTEGVGERGRGEASPELTSGKRPPDQSEVRGNVGVDSADSTTLSGSDGRSGRRRASGEERDKSNKRKSNLNRSTTTEEATDPFPLAHPSDSNEDTPRRRRRRAPVSPVGSNISSVGSSEPLKTPEVVRHVVSRLTPPASPPIHPSPPPTRTHQTSQSTQPPNTFQPIQPAATQGTHSAPSTLDTRSRSTQESRRVSAGLGERNERSETEETLRKVPPKLAPLRKPDIPNVLRPKENTALASPGVVNTPPSSRPSSVVLEKPPLAPEGLRPAAFRSSLRKPPDTGTCFMAARREKRDDTKPEFFREIQQKPKKGDRLSKSDMNLKIDSSFAGKAGESIATDLEISGTASSPSLNTTGTAASFTEEVMSSRLEALTARARDTLERADRLNDDAPPLPESSPLEESADNVVHECEQYLTVNANKKESSSPRMRHRDMGLAAEVPIEKLQTPSAMKGIVSDTGQKNGVGGSEGRGKESKRMALEKEMKRDTYQSNSREKSNSASAVPSGPPIQGSLINDCASPPPEEVVQGLQHSRHGDDDDLGSPNSSTMNSPDQDDGKWGLRRRSLDEDVPRTNSPDPQSILKHRSSREDVAVPDRPGTPEPHSILKRKTSSRNSSIDIYEGDPKPILKKKSSTEELDHFEPRPILKKKSSTDDELDDRPRSILKGRSREDLDIAEGLLSPNPILKRSPRCDSEGEAELRPILKRRETIDGVRLRLHVSDGEDAEGDTPSVRLRSDSAPEAAIRMRGRSPPAPSATPTHGILKKRGSHSPSRFDQMDNELGAILRFRRSNGADDEENSEEAPIRPVSPSLVALTRRETPGRSGERPLSVAERVAGMEAARQEHTPVRQRSPTPTRSPGARPKVTPPSSLERPSSFIERDRESRRNSAFGLVPDPSPGDGVEAINDAFLDRPVAEAYNNAVMSRSLEASPETPSSVSQKAAFFAQLEQKTQLDSSSSTEKQRSTRFSNRRDRGSRHATQPVTEDEVSQAARLAEASDSASASHDSDSPSRRESLQWMAASPKQEDPSDTDHKKEADRSSSVGARVALWTRRLEEECSRVQPLDGSQGARRRSRSARFKTQPVTMEEVAHAHALNNQQTMHTPTGTPEEQDLASGYRAARDAVMRTAAEVIQGLTPGSSPRLRLGSRKTSLNEPEDEHSSDSLRGILKREGSLGSREIPRDSPRSILKHSSSDSRRASFSESDHPRSILKPESPLPPSVGSPEHESKLLKGVLKKDSSLEDSKEIKSILKPESESLDHDHSSDSSSEDVTLTTASTPQLQECDIADSIRDIDPVRHREEQQHKTTDHHGKSDHHHRAEFAEALRQVEPIKAKDDLAEALRQIEPIRAKERSREREDKGFDMQSGITKESSLSTKFSSNMAATVMSSTTTNSSSSNSESEVKTSVIKNEAIMRRRNAHSKRYEDRRSMVELRSLEKASEVIEEAARDAAALSSSQQDTSESSDSGEGFLRTSSWRSSGRRSPDMDASQILRQSPLFRNRASSPSPEESPAKSTSVIRSSSSASSINARLAALQKHGEDGWKDRIKKESQDLSSDVRLRPKVAGSNRERPVSLMERMSALENSSQQWRGRVTQSDAAKFTVAHKIASQSASNVPSLLGSVTPQVTVTPDCSNTPTGSPLVERKKRSPCQKVFKSKTGENLPSLLGKSSPVTSRKDFRRSISTPNDADKNDIGPEGTSVAVPQAADESFDAFFTRTSTESTQDEIITLGDEDLDHISVSASQLIVKRRSVRVKRRQGTFRNPLKTLAAREDLKTEYTEVKMGVGERELRRMKVEELSKGSTMAVEALAGLASKENFSAVSLKKVENNPIVREMAPYMALMLLQVKGRRHAQTKLVEPTKFSVNQGDDFILITPTDVFHYKGEFANVIERAKAAEIALYILQQKDMGITTARNLIELDEYSPSERKNKFWSLLGGSSTSSAGPCGSVDEDEYVEASLIAANKIYEVQGDSLVPIPDVWGQMPKFEILNSDKVLVLDFGSELYVWAGKRACGDERRVGLTLGRELWEEPYDYSDCDINPITPMTPLSQAKLKGSRPEWGLCAKLTENVETILFKEKFIDWPDTAQQSRIKEVKRDLNRYVPPVSELQPCDARLMLEELPSEPDLVLEMSHLGRGVEYYDEEERRLLSISTNDYKVWHVSEYGKILMEPENNRHLHAGDTYVVRWYYLVTATGRTLQGAPSKHNVTGRSRVAYFFWQGRGSSVSDKGVSALMTVELDEERGPHIRVSMGKEPPAFLNLFQGGLVVHKGHSEDGMEIRSCKLFVVRGEIENEGHLVEVDLNPMFLRSRGCLVLVNTNTGTIHLWHGAKALRHTRKVGSKAVQMLSEAPESVMGWKKGVTVKIKEQFEGAESRDFWEDLGGSSSGKNMKTKYFSLLDDEHSYDWTPRIWHLAASPDSFQATEVVCTYRATALPNPHPVLQLDLYSEPQPALFIIDGGHRVWVWQGWWPAESSEGEDFSATGSAVLRFNFARRAALETALNYCKLKVKAQGKALAAKSYKKIDVEVEDIEPQLVVAGMEPLEFTNLFPMWTPREDVTTIQEKEGRWKQGGQYLVSDILDQLSRTHYSLAELTARPLPDGADPLHLEVYLNEEEFSEALGMTRDEFYCLQPWKQTDLKKKANLF